MTLLHSVIWCTNTFAIRPQLLHKIYELLEQEWDTLAKDIDSMIYMQPVPPNPPPSNPNSLGGFTSAHPEKELVIFQAIYSFQDPACTLDVERRARELVRRIDELTVRDGAYESWKYGNYAAWWQDVWGCNGREEELRERLREVSGKYDAEGMFQKQVVGGWKLWSD